jgi:hypothetical protein
MSDRQHRILSTKPELFGAAYLLFTRLDLLGVFMANVNEALCGLR